MNKAEYKNLRKIIKILCKIFIGVINLGLPLTLFDIFFFKIKLDMKIVMITTYFRCPRDYLTSKIIDF